VKQRGLRYFGYLIALGAIAYLAILLVMFARQRAMVFATDDCRALAAASETAIDGSTEVRIATADGEKIAAWYIAPRAGQPVFLFLHGKGGCLSQKKWRWARVVNAGAGILAISYRGYPGSTGSPSEAGLIRDAKAAYDWLRLRHPAEQIVIHGLSLGTGVAVALATQVKARALILEAPYTAIVDVAAERYPLLPVRWLMWDTFLSRERIAGVHMPLLIAHGTRDTVIPFEHAKRLFRLANQPKVFVAMPGSDHSTLVRDGLYTHVWRFLRMSRE
jgi:fermentation-respiration switch protein FrsA (DUF1100 family)